MITLERARPLILLGLAWTVLMGLSLYSTASRLERQVEEMAAVEARSVLRKDMVYRRWAATHGGVYAPITPETPPNPHLAHVEERDITTPSGRALTLINPADMTRQVFELDRKLYGVRGHITSTRPLHAGNAPDAWEREALEALEAGAPEQQGITQGDGLRHLRLMLPLRVEPGCLKCHAAHGYKVGDLRGGLSASVPLDAHQRAANLQFLPTAIGHGLIWLLGGIVVFLFWRGRLRAEQEREEALAALRASEGRHQALFEEAPILYLTVTPRGHIKRANRAARRHLGPALRGRRLFDLFPEEGAARLESLFEARRAIEGLEITYQDREGQPLNGLLWLQPIEGAEGLEEIRLIFIDVSERYRLQDQLRQSQKLESIGQLASGVAHDFNNLLTVILGGCEMLEMLVEAPEPREEVKAIKNAGGHAVALVRQLLAFSRKQVLSPRALDLNVVLVEMGGMLRRLLGEDIVLDLRLMDELRHVRADPHQLEQVIVNLCVNARDAMPKGGSLRIETYEDLLDAPDLEDAASLEAGLYVCLAIRDSGQGMKPETVSRIFEPFFTTKREGKGTGLGLAIVYGIVRQSGGVIRVESAPDKGTTFRVYLPMAAPGEAPPPPRREPVTPRPQHLDRTVLLVEDEPLVRTLTLRLLSTLGYATLSAEDGLGAIQLLEARSHEIHVVLTDVIMPGMNGVELSGYVHTHHPDIHVILMSGYSKESRQELGINAHGDLFLPKPFSRESLSGALAKVLSGDH